MSNRIIKIGEYQSIRRSAAAHEVITPGQLLETRTDGKVQKNSKVMKASETLIAVEDWDNGKGIDSTYAAGDAVNFVVPTPGTEAFLWVAASVATPGVRLIKAANGLVAAETEPAEGVSHEAFAVSLAPVTYVDTPVRVLCRIL